MFIWCKDIIFVFILFRFLDVINDYKNHNQILDYIVELNIIFLDFAKIYRINKKQQVVIEMHNKTKNSNLTEIGRGISEGNILEPLLFVLYINNLSIFVDTSI